MQLSESEICSILNSIHPVMGAVVERLIAEKNQKISELSRQLATWQAGAAHFSDGQ